MKVPAEKFDGPTAPRGGHRMCRQKAVLGNERYIHALPFIYGLASKNKSAGPTGRLKGRRSRKWGLVVVSYGRNCRQKTIAIPSLVVERYTYCNEVKITRGPVIIEGDQTTMRVL